jgi:Protein of unknown function (DUF1353)
MPFLTKTTENDPRKVHLEQIAPNQFRLRRAFRYKEPGKPKVYSIREGDKTDLASVPWPFWWLIASYGRQTKAVLLHDSLVTDTTPHAKRREADRLLFVALKESGFGAETERKTSWARNWLMWSAVALFGTMKKYSPLGLALFVLHLLVFIGLIGYLAVVDLWPWIDRIVVNVWHRVDWIVAPVVWAWEGASSLIRWAADFWPFGWTPEVWQVTAAVGALGMLWALHPSVDTRLGWRLWPWAFIGVVVVAPPTFLVLAAIMIVAVIDLPSSFKWSLEHGGNPRPIVTPTRALSGALPSLGDDD